MSDQEPTPQRTPLFDRQKEAGARMITFSGWEMPVQFRGIMQEHLAVRSGVGVFDISHMGEVFVRGPGALAWLQKMLANDLDKCAPGTGQYTFLLNHGGGVIDDLIAYRLAEEEFLLLVNAAKITEDVDWLAAHPANGVTLEDRSDSMAALAVQGPRSGEVHQRLFGEAPAPRNHVVERPSASGPLYVASTGYTGEEGFEIFCPSGEVVRLWQECLAAGAEPCGLGARDTLRLEMCYPLNGSDLSPERTPLEAGLGFFVALAKPDFIGRPALLAQKERGLPTRLVALQLTAEKAPPLRPHYPVVHAGSPVGETSSGALSPSLGRSIGLAYLPSHLTTPGTALEVDIRGRSFPAEVVRKPFHRKAPATEAQP